MTINISIGKNLLADVSLDMKKTLEGNIMISDHEDMDIVVMPKQNKIITFVKKNLTDIVYSTQDRYFNFLEKSGVTIPGTIRSGNVYGSLEAQYPAESPNEEPLEVVIYITDKFIDGEKDYMLAIKQADELEDDRLLHPDDDQSTELGEVPHEETKGSIRGAFPGYHYGLAGI